jgi:HSP20 family molecular chaperone IbpA
MTTETKELQVQEKQQSDLARSGSGRTFIPRTDIYEAGDTIVLVADMPGVDENSLDITVEKNVLTIRGQVEPPEFEDFSLAYGEYVAGDFQRSFTLSSYIDLDKIEATVKDGVLNVTLPKTAASHRKRITVKTEK